MKNLIERIKTWYSRKKAGLCTKHGVAFQEHGYYGDTRCPNCTEEMWNKFKPV